MLLSRPRLQRPRLPILGLEPEDGGGITFGLVTAWTQNGGRFLTRPAEGTTRRLSFRCP